MCTSTYIGNRPKGLNMEEKEDRWRRRTGAGWRRKIGGRLEEKDKGRVEEEDRDRDEFSNRKK